VLRNFGNVPDSVTALWVDACAKAGAGWVRINDPYHDVEQIKKGIGWSHAAGMTTLVALIYSHSPVHTDEYYVAKALAIAKAGADRIFIKDVDGLLTPERVRTLIPAVLRAIDGIPLELHGHCNTGLAPLCYLEAIKYGIRSVHTAVAPLANGTSQPSIDNIRNNARLLGYDAPVDESALREMTEHFRHVAETEGFPIGAPPEYDAFQFEHQLPGGMISNYEAELAKRGLGHRLEELLHEIARIRTELGYPIMVTPLSQYVGVQAILNLTAGERYKVVTDELIHYVLGHYGALTAPVDAAVDKRIRSFARTRDLLDWQAPESTIESLRAEFGRDMDDEEFLMRALASNEQAVDAMLAGAPKNLSYRTPDTPLPDLIRDVARSKNLDSLSIEHEDFRISLRWKPQ
jgi:oxaloacetate decarboxylase alpha subunit